MSSYNSSTCFFPDGVTDGSDFNIVPCDPLAPASACCPVGTSCLPNGLCLQEGGVLRGACTDKTWSSPVCATVCKDTSGKLKGSQSSYDWLTQCAFAPQYNSFNWVCGLDAHSNCTSENWFAVALSNPTFVDISGLAADGAPSASGAASTATATGHSKASCANIDAAAPGTYSVNPAIVGAGVGAPLAVLVLVMLVTTLWYRRKWIKLRDRNGVAIPSSSGAFQHHQHQSVQSSAAGFNDYIPPMELAHKRTYHAQLDHQQPAVYEIGNEGPDQRWGRMG